MPIGQSAGRYEPVRISRLRVFTVLVDKTTAAGSFVDYGHCFIVPSTIELVNEQSADQDPWTVRRKHQGSTHQHGG